MRLLWHRKYDLSMIARNAKPAGVSGGLGGRLEQAAIASMRVDDATPVATEVDGGVPALSALQLAVLRFVALDELILRYLDDPLIAHDIAGVCGFLVCVNTDDENVTRRNFEQGDLLGGVGEASAVGVVD